MLSCKTQEPADLSQASFGSRNLDRNSSQRFLDDALHQSRAYLLSLGHDPSYSPEELKSGHAYKNSVNYPKVLPASDRDSLLTIFLPAALGYARNHYWKVRSTVGGLQESDFQAMAVDALQRTIEHFHVSNTKTSAFLSYLSKTVNSGIINFIKSESRHGATGSRQPAVRIPVGLRGQVLGQDPDSTFSHYDLYPELFEELRTRALVKVLPELFRVSEGLRMLLDFYGTDSELGESDSLSYRQLSAKYQVPENTVATRLHRVKKSVQLLLSNPPGSARINLLESENSPQAA